MAIEQDRITEHTRIEIELPLPPSVGDHDSRCGSAGIVLTAQQTTQQRTHAKT